MPYIANNKLIDSMNKNNLKEKIQNEFFSDNQPSKLADIFKRAKKSSTQFIQFNLNKTYKRGIEYFKNLPDIKYKISNDFLPTRLIQRLQDQTQSLFNNETNRVFLKQSTFWAKSISWVLMGGTGFAIGWLCIAKTDEVVIALGKLEPLGGVVNVQMPLEGIAREVLVKEGEQVKKGQVLILLDTEITETRKNTLQKTLEFNNNILERLEVLVKEGAVAEVQYLEQKIKIEEIESQIKANLVNLKYQKIISPTDGVVFDMQPKGPGYVAKSSQPVLQIVPNNNLIAKVQIDSRTIGFVKTGKAVEISIDSFPASDFGVIDGVVTRISSDALPPNRSEGQGYRFPADIKLKTQHLELKSGQKLPLQAGMSLSANIKLRKQTYLQLLLNKFGDKAGSLKSI